MYQTLWSTKMFSFMSYSCPKGQFYCCSFFTDEEMEALRRRQTLEAFSFRGFVVVLVLFLWKLTNIHKNRENSVILNLGSDWFSNLSVHKNWLEELSKQTARVSPHSRIIKTAAMMTVFWWQKALASNNLTVLFFLLSPNEVTSLATGTHCSKGTQIIHLMWKPCLGLSFKK